MARVSKKTLRAAVIGCGRVGALTIHKKGDDSPARYFPTNHCAAIQATHGVQLVAVCDTDSESAKKAGALHKVEHIYTNFKKMILAESPDIVAIATRMAGRADIITFAARHGVKGLHIEKPLASNLHDTKRIIDAIAKAKITVSYGTVRRYMPIFRQAKQMVESKKFGKLKQVIVDISKSPLLWAHPHSVDIINYFINNTEVDFVESAFPFNKKDVYKNKIDMDPVLDFGLIQLKNGISGLITDTGKQAVRLICEKGEVVVNIGGKYLKTVNKDGRIKNIKIKKGPSGRCGAIAELRDFINHQKPTSLTAGAILTEQKILLALGLSGITGKKVHLSEVKPDFTITGKFNGLYP